VKVTLSEVYRYAFNSEAEAILKAFPRMVEWWIERAEQLIESGLSRPLRYSEFRNMYYYEWCRDFVGWNTHYAQTSSLVAYTESRLRFPGQARKGLKARAEFAVIHPNIAWIRNGCLRTTTKPREYIHLKLEPKDRRQALLLEQAEKGIWRVGQVLLTREWALIPFLKEAELLEVLDPALSMIAQTV